VTRALGALAVAFYAIHAAAHIARRQPENLLWVCHLGSLAVGLGLLRGSPTLNAIGTFWLCWGLPLWILYLSMGGEFMPTSIGTHVGGFVIGFVGLRRIGLPRGAWWKTVLAWATLVVLTRVATPPAENVNMAHRVQQGWEATFTSYPVYIVLIGTMGAALSLALQFGLPRIGFHAPETA
jgi:hypothetical protein